MSKPNATNLEGGALSVLIVDPDAKITRLIAQILAEDGVEAEACHSGQDALALTRKIDFDAVLVAMELPDIRGIELYQQLQREGLSPPVVFLSALDTARAENDTESLTDLQCMRRLFERQELLERVHMVARLHQAERMIYRQQHQLAISQEMLQEMMDAAPVGIFTVDEQRRILSWNRAMAAITGVPRHQALGRDCADLVRCNADCYCMHDRNTGGPREAVIHRSDGHDVRLLVSSRQLTHVSSDAAKVFIVIMMDITARAQIEAALRRKNDEFALVHRVGQMLGDTQSTADIFARAFALLEEVFPFLLGVALQCSEAGLQAVLHHPEEPAPGKASWWADALSISGIWSYIEATRQVLVLPLDCDFGKSAVLPQINEDLFRAEGWSNLVLIPVLKTDALFGLVVLVNVRVPTLALIETEVLSLIGQQLGTAVADAGLVQTLLRQNIMLTKKEAELSDLNRDLRAKQEQLVHSTKLASVGILAAGVAHEINNPVSIIEGIADQILKGIIPPEEAAANLQVILECAGRIGHIVRNLLQFSRPDAPALQPCLIDEVIRRSLALTEIKLKKARIEVELQFPSEIPSILGRPNELMHVFLNLFANAEHALAGRPDPRTIVIAIDTTTDTPPRLRVRFRDNGRGMTPEVMAKIFTPFFTTKSRTEGTGLGLSISANILKTHHADINATSIPDEITEFTMTFPMQAGDEP